MSDRKDKRVSRHTEVKYQSGGKSKLAKAGDWPRRGFRSAKGGVCWVGPLGIGNDITF